VVSCSPGFFKIDIGGSFGSEKKELREEEHMKSLIRKSYEIIIRTFTF